jgi:hypothetical protein
MTSRKPKAPRDILHLIDQAENMLSVSGKYLTDRHRDRLWQALKEVMAIAPGMKVNPNDIKLITLARLVGGLEPARGSIKKRLTEPGSQVYGKALSPSGGAASSGREITPALPDLSFAGSLSFTSERLKISVLSACQTSRINWSWRSACRNGRVSR